MKIFKTILLDVLANLLVNLIHNKIAANKQQDSSQKGFTEGDK